MQVSTSNSSNLSSSLSGTASSTSTGLTGSGTLSAKELSDRFLTLLVAQIKNQDPLNPMDNAQTTSQLSQLSSLGELSKIADLLETGFGAQGSVASELSSAASLVGKDVGIALDSSGVLSSGSGQYTLSTNFMNLGLSTVQVQVIDPASGQTIKTLNVDAKSTSFELTGLPSSIQISAIGFDNAGKNMGNLDVASTMGSQFRVQSAIIDAGEVWLKGVNGQIGQFDKIQKVS